MDKIIAFFDKTIGNTSVTTFLLSMLPLLELKGAILYARAAGLGFFEAFLFAYLGSTLVFIPVYFLLRPILDLMKKIKWFNAFALKIEERFEKKAETVENKKGEFTPTLKKQLGVLIFVAIPAPMTGVWTGTAVAVFLGLKFKEAILPVVLGNFIAGAIISVIAELFLPYVDIILYGFLAIVVIALIVFFVKTFAGSGKKA